MLNGSKGVSRLTWILAGMLALAGSAAQAQTYVYWADYGNGRIGRVNLATPGSPDNSFIGGCDKPLGVVVQGGNIYWTNVGTTTATQSIGRANLDGSGANQTYIDLSAVATRTPGYITADSTYLYWTEPANQAISRALLADGIRIFPFVDVGAIIGGNPYGITVDGTNVYWTNTFNGRVQWIPLATPTTPANITSLQVTGTPVLGGMVVNSTRVYWGDTEGGAPNIGRATLAGAVLAPKPWLDLSTQVASPRGVSVANKLFFTDTANRQIWMANLDGSSPTVLVNTIDGGFSPWGITVTGAPNVITLASFTAAPAASAVTLNWTTGAEIDNAGFHVWRSNDPDKGFVKVTSQLIPSKSVFTSGASYSWTDASAAPGQTWFYKLEDIDTSNLSTLHGPISAHVGPSAIQSFQAVPATIFNGGTVNLKWAAANGASLSIRGIGAVSGSSLQVRPADTTSYLLTNDAGDQSLTTVTVRGFLPADMPGLSKAWGSRLGDAAFNPLYDMDGDGRIDDVDAALLLKR